MSATTPFPGEGEGKIWFKVSKKYLKTEACKRKFITLNFVRLLMTFSGRTFKIE